MGTELESESRKKLHNNKVRVKERTEPPSVKESRFMGREGPPGGENCEEVSVKGAKVCASISELRRKK